MNIVDECITCLRYLLHQHTGLVGRTSGLRVWLACNGVKFKLQFIASVAPAAQTTAVSAAECKAWHLTKSHSAKNREGLMHKLVLSRRSADHVACRETGKTRKTCPIWHAHTHTLGQFYLEPYGTWTDCGANIWTESVRGTVRCCERRWLLTVICKEGLPLLHL